MALSSEGKRTAIQIVFGIIIVILAYVLYLSITEPYAEIERQQQITEQTRERMDHIRTALDHYERDQNRFPGTLDSLGVYIDTAMMAQADSFFGPEFNRDSLFYSPRSGNRFEYAVNDTGTVNIYLLQDPDSPDHIGSTDPDITLRHAASWE